MSSDPGNNGERAFPESRRAPRTALALLLGACIAAATPARAGTSGSIALTSDYLFRGVTQTGGNPALQGGVTWNHESGFYAGGWGSSIGWLSDAAPAVSSQVELDGFIGHAGTFGDSGVGYGVGANYYWYPGDYPAGFDSPDTLELYAGIS